MKNQDFISPSSSNKGGPILTNNEHNFQKTFSQFETQANLKEQKNDFKAGINPGQSQGQLRASKSSLNNAQDLNSELEKELKRRGDTAVHIAALDGDATLLKDLIRKGLPVFNPSDADGGTALHRAAESGSIECAQILLDKNADIDAPNFMGQTPFHVCGEKMDFAFAKFLLKNRAKRNCRPGCLKCRSFLKQMERHDKTQKDLEQQAQVAKLEEEKVRDLKKKERKKARKDNKERAPEIDFLEELERVREECGGGPYFSKKENKIYKEQQERLRQEEERKQKKTLAQHSAEGSQHILGNLLDIPNLASLLSQALQVSGTPFSAEDSIQERIQAEKDAIKPKKSNKNKKKSANSTYQAKDMIKTQEKMNSSINLSGMTPFSSQIIKASSHSNQLEQMNLTDEQKVMVAQSPLYLNNIQSYPPDSDPILLFGSWKKRQKRLEELEEEKKKTMSHSSDSINCNSDRELLHDDFI